MINNKIINFNNIIVTQKFICRSVWTDLRKIFR